MARCWHEWGSGGTTAAMHSFFLSGFCISERAATAVALGEAQGKLSTRRLRSRPPKTHWSYTTTKLSAFLPFTNLLSTQPRRVASEADFFGMTPSQLLNTQLRPSTPLRLWPPPTHPNTHPHRLLHLPTQPPRSCHKAQFEQSPHNMPAISSAGLYCFHSHTGHMAARMPCV